MRYWHAYGGSTSLTGALTLWEAVKDAHGYRVIFNNGGEGDVQLIFNKFLALMNVSVNVPAGFTSFYKVSTWGINETLKVSGASVDGSLYGDRLSQQILLELADDEDFVDFMEISAVTPNPPEPEPDPGPEAPPDAASLLALYEASIGTTPSVNYEKISAWTPTVGTGGDLVQGTDANRMRVRTASTPVVYQWQAEGSRTMANTTAVINKRDCSVFVLIELGQLIVNGIAENQTIISFPGAVGELYLNKAANNHFKVAWKDGTGTYVSSLVPASSLNLIGVTLTSGAVKVHCNGESETLAASALTAGTVTGFSINFGTLQYGDAWGYHCIAIYGSARDASGLTAVEAWGLARGAVYPNSGSITKWLGGVGASRNVGYHAEGNMDYMWRLGKFYTGVPLYKLGFGGISVSALLTRARAELGLQYDGSSFKPGDGFHRPTLEQMVVMDIPTADVTSGVAEATIISNLTTLRNDIRQSGYDLVVNCMPPVSTWDAGQETKRVNINAAMLALNSRKYGDCLAVPTELSDSSNTTYFYDGIHYTKAGYDALYAITKPYTDIALARTITTLKGHWKLNGNFLDYSGYRRDLQAIGSPTFVAGLNGGQALVCTTGGVGAAKGVYVGREYDTLPLTIVCWFQGKAAADDYCMMKFPASGNIWTIQRHNTTSQIRCTVTGVTGGDVRATDKSYAANTWYGVALVIDSVNGARVYTTNAGGDPTTFALRGTSAWSAGAIIPSTGSGAGALRIGSYSSDATTTSTWVQNPKIFFEALSLAQLQALSTTD